MQPGNPGTSPDRRCRENGKGRSGTPDLAAGKQLGRMARPGGSDVEELVLLAQQLPGTYQQLIANEASRRRLEWADLIARITSHICGLAALLILAAVSWHAIDRGASTQGASIICTGAVSIVSLFVTKRTISMKHGRSPQSEPAHDKKAGRHHHG
jgi:hypothetical protein